MSLFTNPATVTLRRVGRRFGLNRVLGRFFRASGYEARFSAAMKNAIREGDCAWDIGANVGWYTRQFAEWVGSSGSVLAFEPARETAQRLSQAVRLLPNVTVFELGLSNCDCNAEHLPGADPLNATGMIVLNADSTVCGTETILVTRADLLVETERARPPDFAKIDVEGHELEVLQGMDTALSGDRLKHLFIEVHFGVLERQGRSHVPAEIERMLVSKGYDLEWIDPSHLHASR